MRVWAESGGGAGTPCHQPGRLLCFFSSCCCCFPQLYISGCLPPLGERGGGGADAGVAAPAGAAPRAARSALCHAQLLGGCGWYGWAWGGGGCWVAGRGCQRCTCRRSLLCRVCCAKFVDACCCLDVGCLLSAGGAGGRGQPAGARGEAVHLPVARRTAAAAGRVGQAACRGRGEPQRSTVKSSTRRAQQLL